MIPVHSSGIKSPTIAASIFSIVCKSSHREGLRGGWCSCWGWGWGRQRGVLGAHQNQPNIGTPESSKIPRIILMCSKKKKLELAEQGLWWYRVRTSGQNWGGRSISPRGSAKEASRAAIALTRHTNTQGSYSASSYYYTGRDILFNTTTF